MKATLRRGRRFTAIALVAFALPLGLCAQSAAAIAAGAAFPKAGARPLGDIDYINGSLTLVRRGEELPEPSPGDPVFDGDLLRTDSSSSASIALDPSSGFSGSIAINPGTAFYLKRATIGGQPKTRLDLMAGSLSSKLTKIAGSPTLSVAAGESTFGVRGTRFEVALSLNASLLAVCEEGLVAILLRGLESPLPAGNAVQQVEDGRMTPVSFDPSTIGDLRKRWLDEEGAAFRKAPLKALSVFEGRYTEHAKAILDETKALALDPVFRKWAQQSRSGVEANPLDPSVMREKKEIAPKLVSLAKHMAVFERVYWRLRDMVEIVRSPEYSRQEIRKGLTVSRFVQAFDRDAHSLELSVFVYRQALALYGERSPDSSDLVTTLAEGGME